MGVLKRYAQLTTGLGGAPTQAPVRAAAFLCLLSTEFDLSAQVPAGKPHRPNKLLRLAPALPLVPTSIELQVPRLMDRREDRRVPQASSDGPAQVRRGGISVSLQSRHIDDFQQFTLAERNQRRTPQSQLNCSPDHRPAVGRVAACHASRVTWSEWSQLEATAREPGWS